MNKMKDKTVKEFLENNAYFVDFFNAYFLMEKEFLNLKTVWNLIQR